MATMRNDILAKYKLLHNGEKIKKGFHNGTIQIYSSGAEVTYFVDTGISYVEEVESDMSCLSPSTFVPEKEGYEFAGWRENPTASGDILSEKIMDSDPIELYAVFQRPVTLTYDGNNSTSGSIDIQTGYQYYNNGNLRDAEFILSQNVFARTDCTWISWALGSIDGTRYDAGNIVSVGVDSVIYAVWTVPNKTVNLGLGTYTVGYDGQFLDQDSAIYYSSADAHPPQYADYTPDIDCGLFSGITFTISSGSIKEYHNTRVTFANAVAGGTTLLLGRVVGDDEGDAVTYINGTHTVNFAQTSGTTQLRIIGTSDDNGLMHLSYTILKSVILIGRDEI